MKLEHRLSARLQQHLHSWLNTWLQWIGQGQLQDETVHDSYVNMSWGGGGGGGTYQVVDM